MAANPTGVEIRNDKICIWFKYHGQRCREILQGWSNTPSNIKKAGNLRAVIVSEINLGEFKYRERFPNSNTAKKLDKSTVGNIDFSELTTLWLESHKIEFSKSTFRNNESQITILHKIVGKHTRADSIRHSDILAYRNELLHGRTLHKEGTRSNKDGRTVRTVDHYVSLICRLLRFAHQPKYIDEKPFENIKKLQRGRKKPDPLMKKEFNQLVLSVKGQSRNLWQLAVYSGMRHGELCSLAWQDVDLVAGTVNVSRNLTKFGDFTPPKTRAGVRTISLLAPALAALKAQFELTGRRPAADITFQHREYGSEETQHLSFVFQPRPSLGEQRPHYSHSALRTLWNSAIKRSGIRRRNPYHTRHTFACWMLSAGANPAFIASQMGHENAQMLFEVYGAWMDEMNNEQIGLLNAKLAL